ncbi:MAG: hypothetical protein K1X79_03165 [Oligoflexia bacterium]|nr:hypothetical protein [Oligoflexia bacterium]
MTRHSQSTNHAGPPEASVSPRNSRRLGNTTTPQEVNSATETTSLHGVSLDAKANTALLVAIDRLRVRGGICDADQFKMARELWKQHVQPHGISLQDFLVMYERNLREVVQASRSVAFIIKGPNDKAHRITMPKPEQLPAAECVGELARWCEFRAKHGTSLFEGASYADEALNWRVTQLRYYTAANSRGDQPFNPTSGPAGKFQIGGLLHKSFPWNLAREQALLNFLELSSVALGRQTGCFLRAELSEDLIANCIAVLAYCSSQTIVGQVHDAAKFKDVRTKFILELAQQVGVWGRALKDPDHRNFHFKGVDMHEVACGAMLAIERAVHALNRLDGTASAGSRALISDAKRWALRDYSFGQANFRSALQDPTADISKRAAELYELAASAKPDRRVPLVAKALHSWTIGVEF